MQKHFIYSAKAEGDELSHTEWNNLAQDVDAAVDAINQGASGVVNVTDETESGGDPTVGISITSGVSQVGSPKVIELTKKKKGVNTTLTAENNINVEPRESVGTTKGGNISFKPGDDIEFCSHHRLSENQDEVSVKVIDGDDNPVKLQLNTSEITLTTKDKLGEDSNVLNINVNSGKNTKGYLKIRAQAIDLRCEEHGGIALQPKGTDGLGYENKIKFEHDGGDGVEFGTFNTEKTSIYTDQYRFKGKGIIFPVYRGSLVNTYKVEGDPLSGIKKTDYPTQLDDFKDIFDSNTPRCTWLDIVTYIQWVKSRGEGPFTLSYLINSLLPSNQLEKTTPANVIITPASMFYNAAEKITSVVVQRYNSELSVTLIKDPQTTTTYSVSDGGVEMWMVPFVTEQDPGTPSSLFITYSLSLDKLQILPVLRQGDYDDYCVVTVNCTNA